MKGLYLYCIREKTGASFFSKKAREDLNWIKERALAHEKVIIEEAMRKEMG
jgi:hypothetical protein